MVGEAQRERQPTAASKCAVCQASLRRGATRCWLCHAEVATPDGGAGRFSGPGAPVQAVPSEPLGGYSLASLMMFVTMFAVTLGISTLAPGVGIPLGVVLLVVWLRTAAVTRHRAAHGLAVTLADKVQLFLASFGVALALMAVTCVTGFAALASAIFTSCSLPGNPGWDIASVSFVFLGILVAPLILLVGTVLIWGRVIRRRWRRDIGLQTTADRLLLWLLIIIGCIVTLVVLLWWLVPPRFEL